jgi:endonuclease YncB( thermonuclease family)
MLIWRLKKMPVGLVLMLLCGFTLVGYAHAESTVGDGSVEQGRVFRVFDGDRLLVRSRYSSQRVQLAGIDAPEMDQPGGLRSQKILEKMVLAKRVDMEAVGSNAMGEPLVRVRWHTYDINLEMLRVGAAWAGPDASPEMRAAERVARDQGLGIWGADEAPAVAPWEWRADQAQDH